MNKTEFAIDSEVLEFIKAEYMDKDFVSEAPYSLYRADLKGKRFYVKEQDQKLSLAPSVTSVIDSQSPTDYFLIKWLKDMSALYGSKYCDWFLRQSANYGTYIHIVFSRILRQEKLTNSQNWFMEDMENFLNPRNGYEDDDFKETHRWYKEQKRNIQKDVYGFLKWIDEYKIIPLAIEYPMMSNDNRSAGTADLVAKATIKGKEKIVLVDYKSRLTGFYPSDGIQLRAYTNMWNDDHPNQQIERFYSYCCRDYRLPLGKTVVPYQFKDQTDNENNWKWYVYLTMFHADKSNFDFKKKTEFDMIEFDVNTDLDSFFIESDPLDFMGDDNEK